MKCKVTLLEKKNKLLIFYYHAIIIWLFKHGMLKKNNHCYSNWKL